MIVMAREKARLSNKALADRVGISPRDLRAYESGRRRVRASLLLKIAATLNTPLSRFFGATEIAECVDFDGLQADGLSVADCARVVTVFSQIQSPKIFDAAIAIARDLAVLEAQIKPCPANP
jgi:transcriptional regulator with XRE-family HTH domain